MKNLILSLLALLLLVHLSLTAYLVSQNNQRANETAYLRSTFTGEMDYIRLLVRELDGLKKTNSHLESRIAELEKTIATKDQTLAYKLNSIPRILTN